MRIIHIAAAAVLLMGTATFASAQTPPAQTPPAKSKSEPGAPTQGPTNPNQTETTPGVGSRPIGPPADMSPAPGDNPTGVTKEKQKSDQDDPRSGGKKQ